MCVWGGMWRPTFLALFFNKRLFLIYLHFLLLISIHCISFILISQFSRSIPFTREAEATLGSGRKDLGVGFM